MELKDLNPFTQMGKLMETWTKLAEDSTSRATAFWSEIEKADAQRVERASAAIDEIARLQKESLQYGARLGAEVRKLSAEAMKQVAAVVTKTTSTTAAPAA